MELIGAGFLVRNEQRSNNLSKDFWEGNWNLECVQQDCLGIVDGYFPRCCFISLPSSHELDTSSLQYFNKVPLCLYLHRSVICLTMRALWLLLCSWQSGVSHLLQFDLFWCHIWSVVMSNLMRTAHYNMIYYSSLAGCLCVFSYSVPGAVEET